MRYVEKDNRKRRLASQMESYHSDNDKAVSFALRAQGDALRKLKRYDRAIGAYGDLIARFSGSQNDDMADDVWWSRYYRGVSLRLAGRASEGEADLRQLLTLEEARLGADASNTLATRHELAVAVLDQGRGGGGGHAGTSCYRSGSGWTGQRPAGRWDPPYACTCGADQGRGAEAEAMMREQLDPRGAGGGAEASCTRDPLSPGRGGGAGGRPGSGDNPRAGSRSLNRAGWLPRYTAELAFISGRIADALGNKEEAEAQLAEAGNIYAEIYPTDHYYRTKFDNYIKARGAPPRGGKRSK